MRPRPIRRNLPVQCCDLDYDILREGNGRLKDTNHLVPITFPLIPKIYSSRLLTNMLMFWHELGRSQLRGAK